MSREKMDQNNKNYTFSTTLCSHCSAYDSPAPYFPAHGVYYKIYLWLCPWSFLWSLELGDMEKTILVLERKNRGYISL